MKLKDRKEVIGILAQVETLDEIHKLRFKIQYIVEIPVSEIPEEQLSDLTGNRVGIIHIGNKYKIRKIPEKAEFVLGVNSKNIRLKKLALRLIGDYSS